MDQAIQQFNEALNAFLGVKGEEGLRKAVQMMIYGAVAATMSCVGSVAEMGFRLLCARVTNPERAASNRAEMAGFPWFPPLDAAFKRMLEIAPGAGEVHARIGNLMSVAWEAALSCAGTEHEMLFGVICMKIIETAPPERSVVSSPEEKLQAIDDKILQEDCDRCPECGKCDNEANMRKLRGEVLQRRAEEHGTTPEQEEKAFAAKSDNSGYLH